MKVGDIYIEALRLMFATGTEAIYAEPMEGARSLEDARHDDTYADYLLSMPGALNRALADVEGKQAVPVSVRREWALAGLAHPYVLRTTPDAEELRMPEGIAVLLPYYIAGDLYRHEEPAQAAEWRNYYEAGMSQFCALRDEGTVQSSILCVMGENWNYG